MFVSGWVVWLICGAVGIAAVCAAGALWYASGLNARLRTKDQQLALVQRSLAGRESALDRAEREIARLQQIPKAELLPMLQLAHEMRSPLAAIQSSLDMLLQGYAATNAQLQDELLVLARDRAESILSRLSDFMQLGAIRHAELERTVESVQLLDVVHRLAPEMRVRARWRAIDMDLRLPDSLSTVTASREDMEYLVSNLMSNAIKYTNPGGSVTLTLSEDERGVVGVVEDTGIGIAREDLGRVFQEFYRAESAREMDTKGSGLGLAIVKRVVDLYDGQIDVASEIGKGSKFSFVFPKSRAQGEDIPSGRLKTANLARRGNALGPVSEGYAA